MIVSTIIIIIFDENQPSTTTAGAEFLSRIRPNLQRGYVLHIGEIAHDIKRVHYYYYYF